MTANGTGPLPDLFEACLARLEAGLPVAEVIAAAPEFAAELETLLETAGAARALQPELPSPAARQRGRTRLLVQAERLRREQPVRRMAIRPRLALRLALRLAAVLLVLAASLTSLVAASARSLPGDSLYGVKLAAEEVRLNAAGSAARAALEDSLRSLRIDEVRELIRLRRAAGVVFEGVVTAAAGNGWEIGGIPVVVSADTVVVGEILPGMFVEVHGRTTDEGILLADTIYLRAYAFTGTLVARSGAIWQVGSVPVLITAETQLDPDIETGDQVVVLAQVDDAGTISARAILLAGEVLPTPGDAPGTVSPTPDPEPGLEDETEQPEETDDSGPGGDNSGSGSDDSGSGSDNSGPGGGDDDSGSDDSGSGSDNSGSGSDNSGSGGDDSGSGSDDSGSGSDDSGSGSDNSGPGSDNSGSGSGGSETEEPDDD